MPDPFLSNRANASLISESACTCTRVSLHIRWSASHKYVPFLLRLRVCKEQSKCNSREIPNEQVLVESHTHTHIHTRTTRNTTDATVQDLEWSVFECVLMTARHICKCVHVVCTLAWIIWPMPRPPLLSTPPSTRNIQDLEIVLWMTPPLLIGLNTPKHEANLAITLSCLCLILPYRIQTCRAKLSIT